MTSIDDHAFGWCTGLTSVTIPNSVTSIGQEAFKECTGLTKIQCLAQTPPACGDDVFNNVPTSTCVLEVPAGTKPAYAAAKGWRDFTKIEEIQESTGIDTIGNDDMGTNGSNGIIYTFDGIKVNTLKKGLNIFKAKDGSVKKVWIK